MLVVAGPAGNGKSQIFPISGSGVDWLSVDDRCAELNFRASLPTCAAALARSARRSSVRTSTRE